MACFFIVDTYIDEDKGRGSYDDYIEKVIPHYESTYIIYDSAYRYRNPDMFSGDICGCLGRIFYKDTF
jgi:hypothetical protein